MDRPTKRMARIVAHGASAVVVASTVAAMQATGCFYDTPSPSCEDLHEACSTGTSGGRPTGPPDLPDAAPPDKPDAGPPDAEPPDSGPPDAEPPVTTCVPRDVTGGVDESCGVFVSASRAGSEGKGTKDEPFGSLQEAIEAAQQSGTGRVYACAGEGEEFNEAVEVVGGVTLYGGLDCKNDWIWIGDETKTRLTAGEGEIPLTMRGDSGTVRIEDVHVVAQSTLRQVGGAGVSSIAAIADTIAVELVRCELEAGDAAPGADGAPYTERAASGQPGESGGEGCSRNDREPVPGGRAVVNECGTPDDTSDDSIGGRGGDGGIIRGLSGGHGQPLVTADGNIENGGAGWTPDFPCSAGRSGSSGPKGMSGADAVGPGAISIAGYAGVAGAPGARGMPGQGGGGGGGDRGEMSSDLSHYRCNDGLSADRAGAGGGSGGAGGCGGLGGRGGLPGGASIALISLDATLSFNDVTLRAGNGGRGGHGGDGQLGGGGGAGGRGGVVDPEVAFGIFGACDGGRGGRGGDGGKGGGGQGGHSLGIAFRGPTPPTEGVTFQLGDAGLGGNGDDASHKGADGIAGDMLSFN